MKRIAIYIILFFISFFITEKKAVAQKTDTIVHINGNVLTGDLKKLVYGVFTWKMDGMGTISLEEVKVNTIISKKQFEIKMKDGSIYFGSLDSSRIHRKVNILVEKRRKLVAIDDIVEVYPIKRSFWMRTSGNFSLGVNYSKGSDVATVAFTSWLSYRKEKSYFEFNWDNNNTFQADSLTSSKLDASFAWQRLLKEKWSYQVAVGGSQNSELGTKLRVDFNVLGLRDITYNIWNRLYAGAGLSVARETPYDDSGEITDLAGLFQIVWKVYKYKIPKVWVDANISFLPYFTDWGRYRAVLNLNPKVSIFNDDFKVGFTSYYTFDSEPTSDSASTSDYGINLQLTYYFH